MSHNVPLVKKCLTQRMLTNSIPINIFICSSRNCFCTSFNWLIIIRRQKYIFNVYNVYYCNHHNIPWISLQYKKRLLFKHTKKFFLQIGLSNCIFVQLNAFIKGILNYEPRYPLYLQEIFNRFFTKITYFQHFLQNPFKKLNSI